MKELIKKLENATKSNISRISIFREDAKTLLQALTSVKSEQILIQGNTDNVKGNGLWIDSPSVKSESAEDKKQHAIGFLESVPTSYYWSKDEIDSFYNEYLNTLNNK